MMRTHPLALDVGEACIGPHRCCSILSFCPRSSTTSHALCTLWSLGHPLRQDRLMTGYMPHRKRRTATTCRLSPINKQVASIGAASQDNKLLQNVLVDLQALSGFLSQRKLSQQQKCCRSRPRAPTATQEIARIWPTRSRNTQAWHGT